MAALILLSQPVLSCTGITLKSADNGVVVARTIEWQNGDADYGKILIVPRNKKFTALTPEGRNGKSWTGKYGFINVTCYNQPYGPDAVNEEGLYVGYYYFTGYGSFANYDPAQKDQSLSIGDFMQWMLSSFKTVDEVLANIDKVKVIKVVSPDYGGVELTFHIKIADATGNSRIIEIVNNGEVKIYQPYMGGVIANAPFYDWHILNQGNYIGLSPEEEKPLQIGSYTVKPYGHGSGLRGLPGDMSSPSRFVRAAAFTATVRPLATATDAVAESFRILDNFNMPIGSQLPTEKIPKGLVANTQITTSHDLVNRVFYYHTMWNRQTRKIDLKKINFETIKEQIVYDDDAQKKDNVKDVTPR